MTSCTLNTTTFTCLVNRTLIIITFRHEDEKLIEKDVKFNPNNFSKLCIPEDCILEEGEEADEPMTIGLVKIGFFRRLKKNSLLFHGQK